MALELHPTLNDGLTAEEISSTSAAVVWWLGPCSHEWQQRVNLRVSRGFGCVYCSGKQVLAGFNDLESRFPALASQWDFAANSLSPREVTSGSSYRAGWLCPSGHPYVSPISERVRQLKKGKLSTCPNCLNRKIVSGENDLLSTFPELEKQWDWKLNTLDPRTLAPGSKELVWWICDLGHSYDMSPFARTTNRQNCPICAGKRVQAGFNDLASIYPEIAATWDYEKNDTQSSPKSVSSKSGKKYFWLCGISHSYLATVAHRTEGRGCPYCAGKTLLSGFNDLLSMRPDKAKWWSPNNPILPNQVLNGSGVKYQWICERTHEWWAAPIHLKGCPTCANQQLLVGFNDLATVYPELALQWHPTKNGELKPTDVIAGSGKYLWWICPNGDEWKTSPNNRLRTGCPRCSLGGFDQTKPGILYFLRHKELTARKVGITNTDSSRLSRLVGDGWTVIRTWESSDGLRVLNAETALLRWIRKDLGIPPFLHKSQMKNTGGWSETFSDDEPSDLHIIEIVDSSF